jgi:hypothetical protein
MRLTRNCRRGLTPAPVTSPAAACIKARGASGVDHEPSARRECRQDPGLWCADIHGWDIFPAFALLLPLR